MHVVFVVVDSIFIEYDNDGDNDKGNEIEGLCDSTI